MNRLLLILALMMTLTLCLAGPGTVMATDTGDTAHGEDVAAAEGGHGGGHSAPLVTKEKLWDFILRTINFVALFGILFYLLRKPAAKFFAGRREEIANTIESFEKKKDEAEVRFKELEGKLAEIAAERDRMIADYMKDGEEEKAKIIANAHEMAERIKAQAEVTIQQEIKAAKTELVKEIADLSAVMAEDIVKKNINDDDQVRLVEEYLDKVVQN